MYYCRHCTSPMNLTETPAGDDLVYECSNPRCGKTVHASTVLVSCLSDSPLACCGGQGCAACYEPYADVAFGSEVHNFDPADDIPF